MGDCPLFHGRARAALVPLLGAPGGRRHAEQKPCLPEALLDALAGARARHERSRAARAAAGAARARLAGLSERQRQVLAGIVDGRPNKVIAWELGLSVRTVEAYRAQLFERLGARTTADAVRIAVAAGVGGAAAAAPRRAA